MYMYSNLFNAGLQFSQGRDPEDLATARTSHRRPSSARSSWPSRSQSRSQSIAPSRRSSSYNPLSPSSLELASPFELLANGELWFTLKSRRISPRKSARSKSSDENTPEGQLRSFLSLDLADSGSVRSQSRVKKHVRASGSALRAHRNFLEDLDPLRRNSSYLPHAKPLPASRTLPPTPTHRLVPLPSTEIVTQQSHRRNISNLTFLTRSTSITPSVKLFNRGHALAVLEGKDGNAGDGASSFWDMDDDTEAETLIGDTSSLASPATPPAPASLPLPIPFSPVSISISAPSDEKIGGKLAPYKSNTAPRKSANSSEFQFEFEDSLGAEVWKRIISVS